MTVADQRAAKRYKQLKHLQSEVCDALEKADFANAHFKHRSRVRRKTAVSLMPSVNWVM